MSNYGYIPMLSAVDDAIRAGLTGQSTAEIAPRRSSSHLTRSTARFGTAGACLPPRIGNRDCPERPTGAPRPAPHSPRSVPALCSWIVTSWLKRSAAHPTGSGPPVPQMNLGMGDGRVRHGRPRRTRARLRQRAVGRTALVVAERVGRRSALRRRMRSVVRDVRYQTRARLTTQDAFSCRARHPGLVALSMSTGWPGARPTPAR